MNFLASLFTKTTEQSEPGQLEQQTPDILEPGQLEQQTPDILEPGQLEQPEEGPLERQLKRALKKNLELQEQSRIQKYNVIDLRKRLRIVRRANDEIINNFLALKDSYSMAGRRVLSKNFYETASASILRTLEFIAHDNFFEKDEVHHFYSSINPMTAVTMIAFVNPEMMRAIIYDISCDIEMRYNVMKGTTFSISLRETSEWAREDWYEKNMKVSSPDILKIEYNSALKQMFEPKVYQHRDIKRARYG
jgi:hypothetical protein